MEFKLISVEDYKQIRKDLSDLKSTVEILISEKNASEVFTNQELMKLLKVSAKTLQNYRKSGKLSYVRYGGSIWYYKRDIESFMKKHYIKFN